MQTAIHAKLHAVKYRYGGFRLITAIAYSSVFSLVIVLIPWEEIYGSPFVDRLVFTNYFLYGVSVLEYRSFETYADYISNEYLWHALIGKLLESGVSIDIVFSSIAFMLLFAMSLFIVHKAGYLYVLLLINPLVIVLAHSQLRLALAVALLMLAYTFIKYKKLIFAVVIGIASSLIHTASVLILLFWVVAKLTERYSLYAIVRKNNFIILIFFSFFCSFLLGFVREEILSYIGDRRVDYPDMSSSLSYMSFWIGLLGAYFVSQSTLLKSTEHRFSFVVLAVACGNYFFGFYSQRFLAFGLPYIIATMSDFKPRIRLICILAYILYATLQWIYWLKLV